MILAVPEDPFNGGPLKPAPRAGKIRPRMAPPVRMVDVGPKPVTRRTAVASGRVRISPLLRRRIREGKVEKGDPLQVARVAGIAAAKRTPDLLPLCHPVALTAVEVDARLGRGNSVEITATVRARDRTGVEMEALTAAMAACLCVYDLCKKYDRGMTIEAVRLDKKSGGRSGRFVRSK